MLQPNAFGGDGDEDDSDDSDEDGDVLPPEVINHIVISELQECFHRIHFRIKSGRKERERLPPAEQRPRRDRAHSSVFPRMKTSSADHARRGNGFAAPLFMVPDEMPEHPVLDELRGLDSHPTIAPSSVQAQQTGANNHAEKSNMTPTPDVKVLVDLPSVVHVSDMSEVAQ